jgi:hypothetical protein
MRRRKTLAPLSIESLSTTLTPGRAYTVEALCLIFDASPQAIADTLETAVASGVMLASREVRGFRRTFWMPIPPDPRMTTRRWQPGDVKGTLEGYDLMSLARLAMTARR